MLTIALMIAAVKITCCSLAAEQQTYFAHPGGSTINIVYKHVTFPV